MVKKKGVGVANPAAPIVRGTFSKALGFGYVQGFFDPAKVKADGP